MAMFDGSVPCAIPDIPVARDDEWRLRVAQFGDGYAQRTLDGINALSQKWSLTWELRETAMLQSMVDYLVAQQAKAFSFKEPQTGVTYKVFCDTWHVDWVLRRRGGVFWGTLSAEFVRANGVTS